MVSITHRYHHDARRLLRRENLSSLLSSPPPSSLPLTRMTKRENVQSARAFPAGFIATTTSYLKIPLPPRRSCNPTPSRNLSRLSRRLPGLDIMEKRYRRKSYGLAVGRGLRHDRSVVSADARRIPKAPPTSEP